MVEQKGSQRPKQQDPNPGNKPTGTVLMRSREPIKLPCTFDIME